MMCRDQALLALSCTDNQIGCLEQISLMYGYIAFLDNASIVLKKYIYITTKHPVNHGVVYSLTYTSSDQPSRH
jgi:hypothetical protein